MLAFLLFHINVADSGPAKKSKRSKNDAIPLEKGGETLKLLPMIIFT